MRRRRLALWMWYRGERFNGWQSQGDGRSVQDALALALRPLGVTARPMASGRTDRGVHARCQPVSLRVPEEVSLSQLAALGEADWGVAMAAPAPEGFHAQWSSVWKEYRYRLALGPVPPRWRALAWEVVSNTSSTTNEVSENSSDSSSQGRGGSGTTGVPENSRLSGTGFDLERFGAALARARGRRDFSAFEAGSPVGRVRTLLEAEVVCSGDLVELRVRGDGFGRYGVRFLVGGAALVATGQLSWRDWEAALDRASTIRGLRAPAGGLTLWAVGYPEGKDPFGGAAERVPAAPPFVPIAQE